MSDYQIPLPLAEQRSRDITRRAAKLNRRNARKRLPVIQPELVADHTLSPMPGVPATRAQCPTERPCPHVRCRWHLFAESAEHRAGRPGLSSVPRDERGLTLPVEGHVGDERPGTTLRPAWLTYRGLEVEREVKVYIDRDGNVAGLHKGTLEYWLDRLHLGEPVLVFCHDTGEKLTRAKLTADGLALEQALPDRVIQSSSSIVLTRVRGVPSCALDEIERRGKHSNEQVGDAIGRHRTLVAREVRKALGHAIEVAAGMGMTGEDLLRGLRELGQERAMTREKS